MIRYKIRLTSDGTLVAAGTSKQCIKQMGITSVQNFQSMLSHLRNGVNKKYTLEVYRDDNPPVREDWTYTHAESAGIEE